MSGPSRLERILHAPAGDPRARGWLVLAIAVSALFSLAALREGFGAPFVVQDDARQHLFWMGRYVDPALFPGDRIADYFASVSPFGVRALYRFAASFGIDPAVTAKVLPSILGVITTVYCFRLATWLLPLAANGFVASLVLNQVLWSTDGLISATPKAFVTPILLAFLVSLGRRAALPLLLSIVAFGLFYPTFVPLAVGILCLSLLTFRGFRPAISRDRRALGLAVAGVLVGLTVLAPYVLGSSQFGPTITAATARELPEFLPGGRSIFFVDDAWSYWWTGRSGLSIQFRPRYIVLGALLPVLMLFPSAFPLVRRLNPGTLPFFLRVAIVSLGMFLAAHVLLFELHLPSRYTQHTLRLLLVLATALVMAIALDTWLRIPVQRRLARAVHGAVTLGLAIALPLAPLSMRTFPWTGYVVGGAPALYAFFASQPRDVLIASIAPEADNLPSFARRSVLVANEYAIPYHWGYYREFREQAIALMRAQYSPGLARAKGLIERHGIDFWLLDAAAFSPGYLERNGWIGEFPEGRAAFAAMKEGRRPALESAAARCTVFSTPDFLVLEGDCLARTP